MRKVLPEKTRKHLRFFKTAFLYLNHKFNFYDFNSQEEWDKIWAREKEGTWREYENSFNEICKRVEEGSTVLDAGCGLGLLLDRLAKSNSCKTIGLDISKVAINFIKEKGHDGVVSALPEIPLEDNSVDVVTSTELLEHIRYPDDVMKSFKRICRPNGKIILMVPNDALGPLDLSQHHQKYTPQDFKEFLEKHFKEVEIITYEDHGPRILACCINNK